MKIQICMKSAASFILITDILASAAHYRSERTSAFVEIAKLYNSRILQITSVLYIEIPTFLTLIFILYFI